MNFKSQKGNYKVRCGICGNFYVPNNLTDERFKVCYSCKESNDDKVKGKISVHYFKLKTSGGNNYE